MGQTGPGQTDAQPCEYRDTALHLHASQNIGVDPHEIAEVLLHVAVYAGVPAANTAFKVAKKEFDKPASEEGKGDNVQEDV